MTPATKKAAGGNQSEASALKISDKDLKTIRSLVPDLGAITVERVTESSVTTAWGVKWDEAQCSRDVAQNFRDANKDNMGAIKTLVKGDAALISAPAEFNLKRLFFLGSEKGEGDIGAFGEGWKAASLALVRDFKVLPVVISGNTGVCLSISETAIDDTALHPLVYTFFTHDGNLSGTVMLVIGGSKELNHEIKHSLKNFFYNGNELIGEPIFESAAYDVYRSKSTDTGYGFYRGLLRLTIRNLPLVFHLKKEQKTIDKKISQDRDRKAFDDAVSTSFYGKVSSDFGVLVEALRLTEGNWQKGHPFLSAASRNVPYDKDTVSALFEKHGAKFDFSRYYADLDRQSSYEVFNNSGLRAAMDELVGEKRIKVPSYFASFGVESARSRFNKRTNDTREALRTTASKPPTRHEREAIAVMNKTLETLFPAFNSLVNARTFSYLICESQQIMGQLRERGWRHGGMEKECLLEKGLFTGPLHTALATLLHEYAHVFGHDHEHRFSGMLTNIIEAVIAEREMFDRVEPEWKAISQRISKERSQNMNARDKLLAMSHTDLCALFESTPLATLEPIVKAKPDQEIAKDLDYHEGGNGLGDALANIMSKNDRVGQDQRIVLIPEDGEVLDGLLVFKSTGERDGQIIALVLDPYCECDPFRVCFTETPAYLGRADDAFVIVGNQAFSVSLADAKLSPAGEKAFRAKYKAHVSSLGSPPMQRPNQSGT